MNTTNANLLTPTALDRDPGTDVELLARRALVCRQVREVRAAHDVRVTCPCGSRISIVMAFKCRECHIYFCGPCALRHFRMTESATGRWWIETEEP